METIKDVLLPLFGVLAAGGYFGYKVATGYLYTNLSVELTQRRQTSVNEGNDHIVVTMKISKGDRGTIEIDDIKLRFTSPLFDTIVAVEDNRRLFWENSAGEPPRYAIDFSQFNDVAPVLRLTPGESTQFEANTEVPSGETVRIELAILGQSLRIDYVPGIRVLFPRQRGIGQWRASVVSLPIPPKAADCRSSIAIGH
jgi:hypothetical protein